MKELIKTKVIMPDVWGRPKEYPIMEGESVFAKRFNELQRDSWLNSGTVYPSEDLITQILIEDFNNRNKDA